MNVLSSDLSVLTGVSEATIKKFIPLCNYVIGHTVHEQQCKSDELSEVDLGIGILKILVDDTHIKYRFVPDKELESMILQTIKTRRSPILTKLDCNLNDKLQKTYKELL